MACCCSFAGTAACDSCRNRPSMFASSTAFTPIVEVRYVESEPIVRCGDCEWFKKGVVAGKLGKLPNQCLRPTYSGERLELTPEADDFCSWGVRREK